MCMCVCACVFVCHNSHFCRIINFQTNNDVCNCISVAGHQELGIITSLWWRFVGSWYHALVEKGAEEIVSHLTALRGHWASM